VLYIGGLDVRWQTKGLRKISEYSNLISGCSLSFLLWEKGVEDGEAKLPVLRVLATRCQPVRLVSYP